MQTVPSLNITYTEEKGEHPAHEAATVLQCGHHIRSLLDARRYIHTSHLPVFWSYDGHQASHRRCVAVRQATLTCTDHVLTYARSQGDCRVLNLGCGMPRRVRDRGRGGQGGPAQAEPVGHQVPQGPARRRGHPRLVRLQVGGTGGTFNGVNASQHQVFKARSMLIHPHAPDKPPCPQWGLDAHTLRNKSLDATLSRDVMVSMVVSLPRCCATPQLRRRPAQGTAPSERRRLSWSWPQAPPVPRHSLQKRVCGEIDMQTHA